MRERERERAGLTYNYDVIYIDPPYNTESSYEDGNGIANDKENIDNGKFAYRDKFSRNGWLNLINERLRLAKKLIKEDEVIFVSIDDSEQAYLKVLMDDIFGEENFIANFIWEKNYSPKNNNKFVSVNHDYILSYAKNKEELKKFNRLKRNEKINSRYKDKDEKGFYKLTDLTKNSKNKFDIYWNNKTYKCPENSGWIFNKEKIYELIKENRIVLPDDENKRPTLKRYLHEVSDLISKTILNYEVVGHTHESKNEINEILYKNAFDTPKPVRLIKHLIKLVEKDGNSRILDFFAGSGTTGHAVLDLNREDGGNRTYTLVTNNQNNIAKNVNYERLYRINKGNSTDNQTFEWINKNKPYKTNLNVYDIEYMDVSPDTKDETDNIIKKLIQLLKDFGIPNLDINNQNHIKNLLNDLLSLNPQER
ncbi:site-specific DNA-methyltransferase [Mycoplasma sp. 4013]